MLYIFYNVFYDHIDFEKIKTTSIAILVVTAFIVHVYETAYTVKEVENEKLTKKHWKTKAESELAALKAQLDPHFMINSLNTLSYLIENDAIKANAFNQNLADLFRYMLQSKERDLVMLSEELDFLNKYLNLISIVSAIASSLQPTLMRKCTVLIYCLLSACNYWLKMP